MNDKAFAKGVVKVYRVGPRKVASFGKLVGIYLPKKLNFLRGKTVMLTIEVLEENNCEG